MIAVHNLVDSTEQTHRTLSALLHTAAAMENVPGEPRKGFENTDAFLAATSRHLNAVEGVLLPAAHKHVPGGADVVHAYVRACKELETALVTAKAREYGSAYAVNRHWTDIWAAVRARLDRLHDVESDLVDRLSAALDQPQLGELTERLHRSERDAPSRPHPHAPHLGLRGRLARRALHTVDAFWDTAEGRMIPEQAHPRRKKPGLMAQYLLADPRFDEESDGPQPPG